MTSSTMAAQDRTTASGFEFQFPQQKENLNQDEEWFSVRMNGDWKRFRIHDYDALYRVPGLYEALVYDVLKCRSPRQITRLLQLVLDNWGVDPADLRVLDLGAGNGIVAERLKDAGVDEIVGLDILPEAEEAAKRDRPSVYEDYVVTDLTEPEPDSLRRIEARSPNCLVTVAALGFGDIPPKAFATAFNEIETPGWVALSIKDDFLHSEDSSGFNRLIRRLFTEQIMSLEARLHIRHRLSLGGKDLFYTGVVGRKRKDIPEAWIG